MKGKKAMKGIKFMSIIAVFLAAVTVSGFSKNGKGELRGKVLADNSNQGINAVKIEIQERNIVSFTNSDGTFSIDELRPGTITLQVSLEGFAPVERKAQINPGETTELNFVLSPDLMLQHEVIVTATKTEMSLAKVPVSATVIPETEIETSNIKAIQDLFAYLPGIQVVRAGGTWGNKGNIRMQGMNANQSLILVDGQKYIGGHGGVDLATIPVNIVEKIEVVKGPSSVLYGSDAMGGVVHIVTKSPIDRKSSFSLSGTGGSSNTQIMETRGNFSSGRFGGFLGLTYNHTDGRNAETDEMEENVIHGSLGYRFSPKVQLFVMPRYEYSKLILDERTQNRLALNSKLDWKPDALTKVNFRAGFFNYRHQNGNKSSDWDNGNSEFEVAASRLFFGSNLITGGYHFMKEAIDDRGKNYTADQTLHSFFLQDQIMIDAFTFNLGGRMDSHNIWGTEFNPKATIAVQVTDQFNLKGSIGRSFRGPKLVKLFGQYRMGPFMVVPNRNLQPETSIGYQVGADWNPLEIFSAGVSFFRNDVEDLIQALYSRQGRPPWNMTWENVETALTQGVEFSVRTNPLPNLLIRSGYTYLSAENADTGEKLLERPEHSVFIVSSYKIPSTGTDFSLYFDYRGERFAETNQGREKLDPYSLVDLSLSQKVTRYGTLFIRVYNLFNVQNVFDEYNIYGTRILAGLKLGFN